MRDGDEIDGSTEEREEGGAAAVSVAKVARTNQQQWG